MATEISNLNYLVIMELHKPTTNCEQITNEVFVAVPLHTARGVEKWEMKIEIKVSEWKGANHLREHW